MSAPFVAMAAAVDVITVSPHRVEAWGRQTGDLLGWADQLIDSEAPGWLVQCGKFREQVPTYTTARFTLLNAASNLDGVR